MLEGECSHCFFPFMAIVVVYTTTFMIHHELDLSSREMTQSKGWNRCEASRAGPPLPHLVLPERLMSADSLERTHSTTLPQMLLCGEERNGLEKSVSFSLFIMPGGQQTPVSRKFRKP